MSAPRVWSLPTSQEEAFAYGHCSMRPQHVSCLTGKHAIMFSEFLLLLSKPDFSNMEALKEAERSARIRMATCPLAADIKPVSSGVLRLRTWPALSWARSTLPASFTRCFTSEVPWLIFL